MNSLRIAMVLFAAVPAIHSNISSLARLNMEVPDQSHLSPAERDSIYFQPHEEVMAELDRELKEQEAAERKHRQNASPNPIFEELLDNEQQERNDFSFAFSEKSMTSQSSEERVSATDQDVADMIKKLSKMTSDFHHNGSDYEVGAVNCAKASRKYLNTVPELFTKAGVCKKAEDVNSKMNKLMGYFGHPDLKDKKNFSVEWHGEQSIQRILWQHPVFLDLMSNEQDALCFLHINIDARGDIKQDAVALKTALQGLVSQNFGYLLTASPLYYYVPEKWGTYAEGLDVTPKKADFESLQNFESALSAFQQCKIDNESSTLVSDIVSDIASVDTLRNVFRDYFTASARGGSHLAKYAISGQNEDVHQLVGEFIRQMSQYDKLVRAKKFNISQQSIDQEHIAALGYAVISRALEARHLIAVFAYQISDAQHPEMDARDLRKAMKKFKNILDAAANNSNALLGALVRVRLQQALITISDSIEFADHSPYISDKTIWEAMGIHFSQSLQSNIFVSTLSAGITLYRINYGLKAGTKTKKELTTSVTVQLAQTPRSIFRKDCYKILRGTCSGDKAACDHLQTMYWNQGKTAWACGQQMGEHVQNARSDMFDRMMRFRKEARDKFQKILNREALSKEAEDQFFHAVSEAKPANEPESVDLLDEQEVRSAAESFLADEDRVKAAQMTRDNADAIYDARQQEIDIRHSDELLKGEKNQAAIKHMLKRWEQGSDFGRDPMVSYDNFDDQFRYNESITSDQEPSEPMRESIRESSESSKPSVSSAILSKMKGYANKIRLSAPASRTKVTKRAPKIKAQVIEEDIVSDHQTLLQSYKSLNESQQ